MDMLIISLVIFLFDLNTYTAAQRRNHCQEGYKSSLQDSCYSYLECYKGEYVIKQCSAGKYFDVTDNVCKSLTKSLINKCNDECYFETNIPLEGSRNKYIFCKNGILRLGNCNGYFDRLTNSCKPTFNHYKPKEIFQNGKYLIQSNTDDLNLCNLGQRKVIHGSCDNYLECGLNSTWMVEQCPSCQNFEPLSLSCVWSWKYYCAGSTKPTEQPITKIPTELPTTTTITPDDSTTAVTTTDKATTLSTETTVKPTISSTTADKTTASITTLTNEPITSVDPTENATTLSTTPSEEPISTTTSSEVTITTSTTDFTTITTSTTSTKPPECLKNGLKKIYQKGDCKNYLECDSGKWVKKSCSWGSHFDVINLECKWNWFSSKC